MMVGTNTAGNGAYLAPGMAPTSALTALENLDQVAQGLFYGVVVVSPAAVDADHEAIAAYCEAANPPHYYGMTSARAGSLRPATPPTSSRCWPA